jgi:general secretion pathway protein G
MNRKNTGFTLVEILIVVIILGILAAIVIPQFTEASNDARVSASISDLQTVRSQIELYKVQHLDAKPGSIVAADGSVTWTIENFKVQLMGKTDKLGNPSVAAGALGPYLQKFPANPFSTTEALSVAVVEVAADPTDTVVASGEGWWFNPTTGNFGVNTLKYGLLTK